MDVKHMHFADELNSQRNYGIIFLSVLLNVLSIFILLIQISWVFKFRVLSCFHSSLLCRPKNFSSACFKQLCWTQNQLLLEEEQSTSGYTRVLLCVSRGGSLLPACSRSKIARIRPIFSKAPVSTSCFIPQCGHHP